MGMPAGAITCSTSARAVALVQPPTIACGGFSSTICRARCTATSGSVVASTISTCTGWPKTPPASLRCLIARSKERSISRWISSLNEVCSTPILSGPGSSVAPATSREGQPAASRPRRARALLALCQISSSTPLSYLQESRPQSAHAERRATDSLMISPSFGALLTPRSRESPSAVRICALLLSISGRTIQGPQGAGPYRAPRDWRLSEGCKRTGSLSE